MNTITKAELCKYFDHTNLNATASAGNIKKLCMEAIENNFRSVCINPFYVPLTWMLLHETDIAVCTVVGFPLGAISSRDKMYIAEHALENGATEIDMVINVGMLKGGDVQFVEDEIARVMTVVDVNTVVKVIIETCYLTDKEKVAACKAALNGGAQFVKTSTGFGSSGAILSDIKLMRKTVGEHMQIKASGGIRTLNTTLAMIKAGADRIGASKSVDILKEL